MIVDLTKAECEKIVAANRYAHMACCDGDEPYLVPITYVYDGGFFYGFTHEGRKIELLRKNPKMCVQVENVKGEREWESAMCWGLFEEVTDPKSIQDVKLLFADQHGASVLAGEEPAISPMVERLNVQHDEKVVVYRMQPYRVTGRAQRS